MVLTTMTAIQLRIETALTAQSNTLLIASKGLAEKLNEVIYELERAVPAIDSIASHTGMIEIATKMIQSEMLGRPMEGEDGIRRLQEDISMRLK